MAFSPEVPALSIGLRTIQKLRIRILPFVFLLYVIAYLDRINIGFAALTMNKELGITSQQFGLVAGIFFFLATSFSKSPAISCYTKSEHVSGSPGF